MEEEDKDAPLTENASSGADEKQNEAFSEKIKVGKASSVVVKEHYNVLADSPLPELDMPGAKAYEVVTSRNDNECFALVCDGKLPIRSKAMISLRGVNKAGLLPLVDSGASYWPNLNQECMIIIYERPLGGKVMTSMDSTFEPIRENILIEKYGNIFIDAIRELYVRNITHRAIRIDNMYYMDEGRTNIVFGDCVTSPSAYFQPLCCETIESSMANNAGRDVNTLADDIYSLGVAILMLYLGENPVANMKDVGLFEAKKTNGSYAALVGKRTISKNLVECLRGMLSDNPKQRWTLETFEAWVGGRRLSPVVTKIGARAKRSLEFNGKSYFYIKDIAYAMATNWDSAIDLIKGEKKLEVWVRRGLRNNFLADAIVDIEKETKDISASNRIIEDVTIAKICMLFDPIAPIRYRTVSFFPDGFGVMLSVTILKEQDVSPIIEVVSYGVVDFWYENQLVSLAIPKNIENARSFFKHTIIGYGLERVLYELNKTLPCQSSLLRGYYVDDIRKVLPALDDNAKNINQQQWPVDRHLAAFIGCHFREQTIEQIDAINNIRPDYSTAGMLSLLAVLQWKMGQGSLLGLASWVGGLMAPIIDSYHSKDRRLRLEKEIPKIVRKGSLPDLYNLLDNKEERQLDTSEYAAVKVEFISALKEYSILKNNNKKRDGEAQEVGQQISAIVSFIIMLVSITILLVMRL
ncbi:MAG: protein kinase family protein [Alphaproteobacteria bacterium]|nr:protein kinase family protein [Alphaproteobacteria bacterium]